MRISLCPTSVGVQVVGVGGVDQGDPGVERGVDGGDRPCLVRSALDRHRHPAEPDRADVSITDSTLLHVLAPWSENTSAGPVAGPTMVGFDT